MLDTCVTIIFHFSKTESHLTILLKLPHFVYCMCSAYGGRGRISTRTISEYDHCWRQAPFSAVRDKVPKIARKTLRGRTRGDRPGSRDARPVRYDQESAPDILPTTCSCWNTFSILATTRRLRPPCARSSVPYGRWTVTMSPSAKSAIIITRSTRVFGGGFFSWTH